MSVELRQWAARQAVEGKPHAEGHIYAADCPWCQQKGHELAALALDVIEAANYYRSTIGTGIDRAGALHDLFAALDAFEALASPTQSKPTEQ